MKIIYKLSELEKVKKLYIALGLDTKKIDDRAAEFKKTMKSDLELRAEVRQNAEKKVKP